MTTASAEVSIIVDVREQPRTNIEGKFVDAVIGAVVELNHILASHLSISARIDRMRGCCADPGEHLGAFVSFAGHASEGGRMRHDGRHVAASLGAVEFSRMHLLYDRWSEKLLVDDPRELVRVGRLMFGHSDPKRMAEVLHADLRHYLAVLSDVVEVYRNFGFEQQH